MTPAQCRAARALIEMEQLTLAGLAGVARATIIDFEKGQRAPRSATVEAIRGALEVAGVEFIAENGGGLGLRMKK